MGTPYPCLLQFATHNKSQSWLHQLPGWARLLSLWIWPPFIWRTLTLKATLLSLKVLGRWPAAQLEVASRSIILIYCTLVSVLILETNWRPKKCSKNTCAKSKTTSSSTDTKKTISFSKKRRTLSGLRRRSRALIESRFASQKYSKTNFCSLTTKRSLIIKCARSWKIVTSSQRTILTFHSLQVSWLKPIDRQSATLCAMNSRTSFKASNPQKASQINQGATQTLQLTVTVHQRGFQTAY